MKKKVLLGIGVFLGVVLVVVLLLFLVGKGNELSESEKVALTDRIRDYEFLLLADEKLENFSKLDNNVLLYHIVESSGKINSDENFTTDEVRTVIASFLGTDYKYMLQDIRDLHSNDVVFYLKGDKYTYNESYYPMETGIVPIMMDKIYVTDSYKKDELYYIEVNIVYEEPFRNEFYSNAFAKEPFLKPDVEYGEKYEFSDDDYEQYKDQLDTVRFAFSLEDGNYMLKEVTVL